MNFYERATRFCLSKILVAVAEQSLDHRGVIVASFVLFVFSSLYSLLVNNKRSILEIEENYYVLLRRSIKNSLKALINQFLH